ncbi:MAG: hypothetical protein HC898_09000, partial [Phycisphaerales bacterium]|nr:hypothetical protein [Phycisphaerales bacterium]
VADEPAQRQRACDGADLLLTSDELDRAITEKAPEIVNLPSGVTVRSQLRPVRMRIARRDPAALNIPSTSPAPATTAPVGNLVP